MVKDDKPKTRRTSILLTAICAQLAAVAHLMFGVAIFSSILLMSTLDTTEFIVRFMLSSIMCRIVATFELAGCRRRQELGKETAVTSPERDGISTHFQEQHEMPVIGSTPGRDTTANLRPQKRGT